MSIVTEKYNAQKYYVRSDWFQNVLSLMTRTPFVVSPQLALLYVRTYYDEMTIIDYTENMSYQLQLTHKKVKERHENIFTTSLSCIWKG